MTLEEYKKILRQRLDEKRYYHSLCVADEAKRLAKLYGADCDKMYLAGLLHDITKNLSDNEQLQIFKKFDIMLTDIEMASPSVWHAMSAPLVLKHEFGITDSEILSAVRYHTTGKPNMTLAEKIIYSADLTSKDRNYNDVADIRETVNKSLDECILKVLKFTITNLVSKGVAVHPDTLFVYNEMIKER
jgi:nicotinate-nucleotide adenylyltransferase